MAEEMIGNYRLIRLIHSGNNTVVYEVVELTSGRHFGMKLLHQELASSSEQRRLFMHEAEVGRQLAHPNIIRIVSVGQHPEPYYVMEYFPAGNLRVRIQRHETDFLREHTPAILKQAATGLAFVHGSGWVHRDIKPDNILVNAAGELKLIDFALAQRIPRGLKRLFWPKAKAAGTLSYISPEQIRSRPLDGRADMYSFAASAYELVTGRPPFTAAGNQELLVKHIRERPYSPQTRNPDLTKEFSDLVLQMLAKKKEDRPKDFHEVLMKLRSIKIFKSEPSRPAARS
jgi:serine/threonine protein kinase